MMHSRNWATFDDDDFNSSLGIACEAHKHTHRQGVVCRLRLCKQLLYQHVLLHLHSGPLFCTEHRNSGSLLSSLALLGPATLGIEKAMPFINARSRSLYTHEISLSLLPRTRIIQDEQAIQTFAKSRSMSRKKWPTVVASLMLIAYLVGESMRRWFFGFADPLWSCIKGKVVKTSMSI